MKNSLIKKKSKIHGLGIFTGKVIKKGERFYLIPLEKSQKYPKSYRYIKIKEDYINDNKVLNWVNHSCEPNIKICFMGKPALKSIKDIKKGEELTVDYNKTELKKNKTICKCNSKKCKGGFYRGD